MAGLLTHLVLDPFSFVYSQFQANCNSDYLRNTNLSLVVISGQKTGELVRSNNFSGSKQKDISVYKIPYVGRDKSHYCKTGRGLNTKFNEQRRDIHHHRASK